MSVSIDFLSFYDTKMVLITDRSSCESTQLHRFKDPFKSGDLVFRYENITVCEAF